MHAAHAEATATATAAVVVAMRWWCSRGSDASSYRTYGVARGKHAAPYMQTV